MATVRSATRSAWPSRTIPPSSGAVLERADRLVVCAADQLEVFVRVPGCEERDREDGRAPQAHAAMTPDTEIADRHQRRAGDERNIGHATVRRHAEVPVVDHARDLGHRDRRERSNAEREQHLGTRRRRTEGVGHAVVHEHGRHPLEHPLAEEGEASFDRRRLRPHQERGQFGDGQDEGGIGHRGLAGEHDHEGERDREGGSQRGAQLDQLPGRDGAADHCEGYPRAPGPGDLDTESDRRTARDEDEQPSPASHELRRLLLGDEVTEPGRPGTRFGRRDGPLVVVDLVAVAVVLVASFDRRDERVDAPGVELGPGAGAQLGERSFLAERPAVRAGRGHRIERIGHVDDRGLDEAGPVDGRRGSFGGGITGDRREEVDAVEELDRHRFVAAHPFELGLGEAPRLVEQLVGHDELADVVHQRRVAESFHPALAEVELGTDVLGESGDALRVAGRIAVLGLEGEDQGLDGLLLARLQLQVARERRTGDQDRDHEQRHDRGTQLEVHPPEPQPQHRKRKRPDVERRNLPQDLEVGLLAAQGHRDSSQESIELASTRHAAAMLSRRTSMNGEGLG